MISAESLPLPSREKRPGNGLRTDVTRETESYEFVRKYSQMRQVAQNLRNHKFHYRAAFSGNGYGAPVLAWRASESNWPKGNLATLMPQQTYRLPAWLIRWERLAPVAPIQYGSLEISR